MLYIGKKPEKPSVGKIIVAVSAAIAGVAALAIVAYKLYQKFVPACIDCECEDFLDDDCFDEDFPEDYVEIECEGTPDADEQFSV